MKFDRYKIYKEGGIPWLHKIPEHWQVERAKSIFKKMSRSISDQDKIITVFRDGEVTLRENRRETGFTNAFEENGYQGLKKGDLVFHAMDAFAGAIGVSDSDGKATPEYLVYTPIDKSKIYIPFYGLFFRQMALSGFVLALGKSVRERSPRFKHTKFMTLDVPIPPIKEQKAIATYLDTKTAQIDRKIDLLTQKAQRYEELKQSLINETVTRGLDKSVPMKDSGIEWIGEIPEHWNVQRLKDLGFLYSGLTGKAGSDFTDNHQWSCNFIPFVNIANNQYISLSNMKKVVVAPQENQNRVKKDDLFFLMSSENYEDIGKTSLLQSNIQSTYLNSFCKGFRFTTKRIEPSFANYLLSSQKYRNCFAVEGKGFTRINLKIEKVRNLFFLLPPNYEQAEIAGYLDKKVEHINQIIKNLDWQIKIQKELRKSLINDVVTGKIKVTDNE